MLASQLRSNDPDHLELLGHVLEHLGDILANLAQHTATVGTTAARLIEALLARQMFGQGLAPRRRRLGPRRSHRRENLVLRDLELLQLQLALPDLPIELLGGAAELHAPKLSDQKLQMLELEALRDHQLLQLLDIIGKRSSLGRHALEWYDRACY